MKKIAIFLTSLALLSACGENDNTSQTNTQTEQNGSSQTTGQSGVKDDTSSPNIVQVAISSKDHTTLVTAVKTAELVDVLSNAGPFTVFAPTNAAFDKLPKGTVEGLLKPEKKNDLKNILEYHTYVGVLSPTLLQDGATFEQVNGGKIKITNKDGKIFINDKAEITATINTSNGVIHVINEVLLPQ
ncbi:MAG: fasciclin domain-containing protein [Raineya sp.]|jgi:uncharacterized surface protein with fasciclin (FAS1) repeats|nr:fasciclin domain-containing protein [Raineya sp.]